MFGWNRNPMEKRKFVDTKTGEEVVKPVINEHDEVIGSAGSSMEAAHLDGEHNEEMREAA